MVRKTDFLVVGIFLLIFSACAAAEKTSANEVSPGVSHPDTAGFRVVTREEVAPPEVAADFTLLDQSGSPRALSDLKGQVVMMSFLYTNCPEACPLVAANFVALRREISGDLNASDLSQILISTDPERDTQHRRNVYTRGIGGDWYFLGGPLSDVALVWEAYDIYRELVERNMEVVVYHSYRTYLIDRNGLVRYEYVGVWYPDDIKQDVLNLLNEN